MLVEVADSSDGTQVKLLSPTGHLGFTPLERRAFSGAWPSGRTLWWQTLAARTSAPIPWGQTSPPAPWSGRSTTWRSCLRKPAGPACRSSSAQPRTPAPVAGWTLMWRSSGTWRGATACPLPPGLYLRRYPGGGGAPPAGRRDAHRRLGRSPGPDSGGSGPHGPHCGRDGRRAGHQGAGDGGRCGDLRPLLRLRHLCRPRPSARHASCHRLLCRQGVGMRLFLCRTLHG